jgi:ribosomal protein S18 acetylase RimI-like enzyme
MNSSSILVRRFSDARDLKTQRRIIELYDGVFEFAPILHQALSGNDALHIYVAYSPLSEVMGAAVLKSPESVWPIGAGVQPIAWVVSDVCTAAQHRRAGIGLVLMRQIEGVVRRVGGRILYLYTESTNEPAIGLYVKAGFERLRDQHDQAVFAKLIKE